MAATYPAGLMWFRRDLRLHDNAALHHALRSCGEVHATFVFDTDILDALPRQDRRVEFIHGSVGALHDALAAARPGAGLIARHAAASEEIPRLARALGVQAVFANHDDEPAALARDHAVRDALAAAGIAFHTFKDHVIFERQELLTQGGRPYSVFTPYKRAWLAKVDAFYLRAYPVERYLHGLAPRPQAFGAPVPSLREIDFEATNLCELALAVGAGGARAMFGAFEGRLAQYHRTRDFPAQRGPSGLGVHLRFGTLSIREAARLAHARSLAGDEGAATWLGELVWRDFYMQVLANFPHVAQADGWGGNFRREYDAVQWESGARADELFTAWCEGRTGYPLVDAAIAELLSTGSMHNRLRMVTASFLCKDLGIDWRRGERFFAERLIDYELASNNGGWQWAASTGTDAQPWFRIFNPVTQSGKFDARGDFIRRYLPRLSKLEGKAIHAPWLASKAECEAAGIVLGRDYPRPIVDHDEARRRTLARYATARVPAAP